MYVAQFKIIMPGIWYNVCLTDFVKTWPLQGFRQASGTARFQASAVSQKVGSLPSWWVQLDSPGTALIVGGSGLGGGGAKRVG